MRRSPAILSALCAALLLAACGDSEEVGACGPDAEKRAIADLLYQWYLYPDTLPAPASVDFSQFQSSRALLEFMTATARAQDLDRGWSFLTTAAEAQATFEEGTAVGFGVSLLERDPDLLFVSQVFAGSAAAEAGFRRGDRIVRIGTSAATLQPVGPAVAAHIANPEDTTLGQMLGPAQAGETRVLEVIPADGSAAVPRTVTKRTFGLDPVPAVGPAGERFRIFDRGGKKLGYVALRTFIRPADALLTEAVQAFNAAGVTDVVVDLRYNGGGLVSTGELLANLLGGGIAGTMTHTSFNPARALQFDEFTPFAPRPEALTANRLAFITTRSSASASELVPNALEPYRPVALVGARTHGKPVGQIGFQLRGCETVAYVVAFRLRNAQGDGEYFGGLPDVPESGVPAFSGPLCDAEDDLANEPGEEAEASTAAALAFLETGTCPTAPAPAAKPGLRAARPPDAYPEAPDPSFAQRHVNGLF